MRIDIWSDIACPWCYIGKRRLESALADFEHAEDVEVVWHSFELDPQAPVPPTEQASVALERKYGGGPEGIAEMQERVAQTAAQEGLDYRLDETLHVGTRPAHRLLHLALETGGPRRQDALKERLLADYFVRALDVSDHAVLGEAAASVGLAADEVQAALSGDRYEAEIDADIRQARAFGANGVPFFVVDGRYGISGAQPVEVFAGALRQAWDESHPQLTPFGGSGAGGSAVADGSADAAVCGPDGCELPGR